MVRAVLLTFMNPKDDSQVDELHTWLDAVHIPEMLAVPGCKSVTRYTLSPHQQPRMVGPRHRFLNRWEIETASIAQYLSALATHPCTPTAALDVQSRWYALYVQIGERRESSLPPPSGPHLVRMISVVFTGPKDPTCVAEYHSWLDETHVPEMLAVPGCRAGLRYAISPDQPLNTVGPRHPFLNIWEIEAESGAHYQRDLAAHPRTPTPLSDRERVQHANYERLGERRP